MKFTDKKAFTTTNLFLLIQMPIFCEGGVPTEPLHPQRAAAQVAHLHPDADPSAGRHVRHRILTHPLPQDDLPRAHHLPAPC